MNYFSSFNFKLFSLKKDDYEIKDRIEHLTKQPLFIAKFTPLNVPCVVRIIDLTTHDLDLLETETDTSQFLNHPNICKSILSFIHTDECLYTIYPYSPYESLDTLSKPYGLSEPVVGLVLKDILEGLDYLHRNNVIHRSIEGRNIYMFGNLDISVKFVLAGLRHCYNGNSSFELQAHEYPKNAHKFLKSLSPEILEQNILGYNYKSDIYSIGILCCELANGLMPFDNIGLDEILFYKLIGDIPKLLDATCVEINIFKEIFDKLEASSKERLLQYSNRIFSPQFQDFTVNCCLQIEPSNRPTARELLNHDFILNLLNDLDFDRMYILAKEFKQIFKNLQKQKSESTSSK